MSNKAASSQEVKQDSMWSNKKSTSKGALPGRAFWGPLVLMLVCSPASLVFWFINAHHDGSITQFISAVAEDGLSKIASDMLAVCQPDMLAAKILFSFMAFELVLMRLVPGKTFNGPISPAGNTPVYRANGLQCFFITIIAFFVGAHFDVFRPAFIYDHMGPLLSLVNVFALGFCVFLYFKGLYFPSSKDSGSTGNCVFDIYWGTELYPRLFGWDVKQFTNCRFSMMVWPLLAICYAYKQYELYGEVSDTMMLSAVLQTVYIAKFFLWETGYLASMDIAHDRAGYYIVWGVLCWVPSFYAQPSFWMVIHPANLGPIARWVFLFAGLAAIAINYDSDRQRQDFRKEMSTKKASTIWGKPAEYITASYISENGKPGTSLLLTSGYWGWSRHFHYVPELTAAFIWTVPQVPNSILPYGYFLFLFILLVDRSYRDDSRCRSKYGKDWDKYCARVPYYIVPGLL